MREKRFEHAPNESPGTGTVMKLKKGMYQLAAKGLFFGQPDAEGALGMVWVRRSGSIRGRGVLCFLVRVPAET